MIWIRIRIRMRIEIFAWIRIQIRKKPMRIRNTDSKSTFGLIPQLFPAFYLKPILHKCNWIMLSKKKSKDSPVINTTKFLYQSNLKTTLTQ
jgi:hypothetical protein